MLVVGWQTATEYHHQTELSDKTRELIHTACYRAVHYRFIGWLCLGKTISIYGWVVHRYSY